MFQDVEIIEENREIIEISDDDCALEEDSKDLLLLNNVPETTFEDNEVICIAIPDEVKHQQITTDAHNTQESLNTESYCIPSGDKKTTEDSNDARGGNSQGNETNQHKNINKQHNRLERINNSISNVTALRKLQTNRRKRKQKKKSQNSVSNDSSIYKESNSFNNIAQNENNSSMPEEATCSSNVMATTSSTEQLSDNYDFSKLKWLRPLSNLSSPSHLQIVIIDRSHPFWRITNDKWLMIEKRLLEALNSEMLRSNDKSIGLFDGAKWQRGVKIVGCHNENAFDFIMKFIKNLDKLWCGAKLDAFPISNINCHVIKAYIPPPSLKTELIMSLIKLQNPAICTKDWKIIRERERENIGGIDIWIRVNNESFTQLSRLRGEVKFGINRIFLNPSH